MALPPARHSASRPPMCSSARPGSSARRCRWSRSSTPLPKLAKKLSVDGAHDAARGILTTDHKPKEVVDPAAPASPSAEWPRAAA